MISVVVLLFAIIGASLIATREPEHWPVVAMFAASAAYASISLAGGSERVLFLALPVISAITCAAYLISWGAAMWVPVPITGCLALTLWSIFGEPPWEVVAMAPIATCSAAGLLAFAFSPRRPLRVTDVVLSIIIAGDICGLALYWSAPSMLHWEGRLQALGVALVQIAWLIRERQR